MLGRLDPVERPQEVLVGAETSDDAAVFRLPDGTALVQSVDFFTPIVDDAFAWGRIAAANALSDIYAMGAKPVLALNLVAWPIEELGPELLADVLRGGAAVAAEAGVAIAGGHSITDAEPKYGMAVTGLAEVDDLTLNSTARPGASLWLTKPLGIGVITTAIKRDRASTEQAAAAIEVMTTLNRAAAEAARAGRALAVTDVTGFGLLGHLHEMLAGSGLSAVIGAAEVPVLEGALTLAGQGVVPSGTRRNHDFLAPHVSWGDLPEAEQMILADAQTSGGLLVAVDPQDEALLREAMAARSVPAVRVGVVGEGAAGSIEVRGRLRGI